MRKIEPEFITGMGYIGASPGVLYHMGGAGEQTVVTGNPALLEGVKGNRFTSLTLHGKSTQEGTTGAQLFPPPSLGSVEKNGITLDYMEDGKIHIRGTAEITTDFYVSRLQLSAATYTLSVGVNIDTRVLRVALCDNVGIPYLDIREDSLYTTGTIDSAIDVSLLIRVYAGKSIDLTVQPMLNIGSAALPYEPYTGGKPSPSPEYPQGIESAGDAGEIAVNVLGKNLIPFPYPALGGAGTEIELKGVKYTVQSDGGIRCTGTVETRFGPTLSNIKFSDKPLSTLLVNSQTDGKIVLSGGALFFDSNNNALFIYYRDSQVGEPLNIVIYPQIELGTVATEYEQYKPVQTLHIPTPNGLPGIPVSSGGNYTDEKGQQWVADEIDLAKGYMTQWIYEYRFTGEEEWNTWGVNKYTEGITGFYLYLKNTSYGRNEVLNTHAIFRDSVYGGRNEGTFLADISKKPYIIWSIKNEYLEDVSSNEVAIKSFEKMLGEINAKMLYCLAEPIRTPLSPETIAAYKALHTYSPTTTVINDASAGMSAGYRRK